MWLTWIPPLFAPTLMDESLFVRIVRRPIRLWTAFREFIAKSAFDCVILCRLRLKRTNQPRNNHSLKDYGIRPDHHLTPEVAALRVDPRSLWDVPFTEQQVDVADGNLRVEHSGENEHPSHGLSKQALPHQGHSGQDLRHLVDGCDVVENGHERWYLIKQIFAIAQKRVHQELLLEKSIHRRGLGTGSFKPRVLDDRHLRRPVGAPTNTVNGNAGCIYFGPALKIVQHTR